MTAKELLPFLTAAEKLKCNTRHSWTSTGRRETVAAHSWRLALLALLAAPELPGVNGSKLVAMCLLHDLGEAVTGDIPSFVKTGKDEGTEEEAVRGLLKLLPEETAEEWAGLFEEMRAMETPEAGAWRALDKLEAVLQHNEAPLSTWIPLEYELNLTYGAAEAEAFPFLRELRAAARENTLRKLGKKEG